MSDQNIKEIIKSALLEEAQAIIDISQNIDSSYEQALEIIHSSKLLICSGIGKSGLIAKKISATFSSLGIASIFLNPVEALHGDMGLIRGGEALLILSKSGNTEELLKFIPYIKNKVKIIGILSNTNSPLVNYCDVILDASIKKEACAIGLAPTSSTTLSLAIADALAIASTKIRNFTSEQFALNHPLGQLGRNISLKVADVMHKNEKLSIINNEATFKEAIIEITEKSLGAVCIVDAQNFLVGLITDGDIRRALYKYNDITKIKVSEIMTSNPISIHEDILIGQALSLMENREKQLNVLPVIDNLGKCVGLVRIHDLIKQ